MDSALIAEILSRGKSLQAEGVNNWALSRPQALEAIGLIAVNGGQLIGGDVYAWRGNVFASTYDSWHSDKRSSEEAGDFSKRSCEEASRYVRDYRPETENVYFVLVVI